MKKLKNQQMRQLKTYIITSSIFLSFNLFSQINIKVKEVYNDSFKKIKKYTLKNKGKDSYVVWFTEGNKSIHDYFFVGKDFTLISLLCEQNFDNYDMYIFYNFLKIIDSNEKFIVSDLNNSKKLVIHSIKISDLDKVIQNAIKCGEKDMEYNKIYRKKKLTISKDLKVNN